MNVFFKNQKAFVGFSLKPETNKGKYFFIKFFKNLLVREL